MSYYERPAEDRKTRKINVTLTLEVDVDAWGETYGLPNSLVQHDVREYVQTAIQGCHAAETGLIASATAK